MRILVVEDDYELARSLKRGLEVSSYAVDVVHDGLTGQSYILSDDYDAAIIDWMLPEQSGIDLCRAARAAKCYLPIIILTAKSLTEHKVAGLDAGADDYLTKPFAFRELLARLRAVLRRPAESQPVVLRVGEVLFDTTSQQVTRDGQSILLSARESALLELLFRYPQKIFSKEELVARVWNDDATVLPSTIESHIANLRAKLDKPFSAKPIITTVWGRGYTVRCEENS